MTPPMTYCIHCGQQNLPEARFCQACGKPLNQPAQGSAARSTPGQTDCPYCGSPMQIDPGVTQLLCLNCAAALAVEQSSGTCVLTALKF